MDIEVSCHCGTVKGVVKQAESLRGKRFICMCDDCQTYAHFLGHAKEILDANGGTEVIPVFPGRLQFTAGKEKIQCVRLAPKGLFRWYSSCCGFPLANSISGSGGYIGFIARRFQVKDLDQSFGPIRARIMAQFGKAPLPENSHKGTPVSLMLFTIRMILGMNLRRMKWPSPFFSKDDQPIVVPRVLTLEERKEFLAQTKK